METFVPPRWGHRGPMSNPALPGDPTASMVTASMVTVEPPPLPSIAASALLESRLLVERTRRSLLAWLTGR